jgi:hypothetical protein
VVLPAPPHRIPPLLNQVNRAFWTAGLVGELRICRCGSCGLWNHPPTPVCRRCLGTDLVPTAVSGRGTVATFTVNYQQWTPKVSADPYVIALVELEEQAGLRLITNIVNAAPSDVRIGMPVGVAFVQVDDTAIPVFEPDQRAGEPG